MKHLWSGVLMVVLAGAVPAATFAHEGHVHKVMGTVSGITGKNLTVKTTDGKTVTVVVEAKTKVTQGTRRVESSILKVGDRIVAEGAESKDTLTATSLRVGEAPPPSAARQ